MKVNDKKQCIWLFQNTKITQIIAHVRCVDRGIGGYFSQGLPNPYCVTGCLNEQLKIPAKMHQIYTAHLLRDLNGLIESEAYNCDWNKSMNTLLLDGFNFKKDIQANDYQANNSRFELLECRISSLLFFDLKSVMRKTYIFLKRMIKHKNSLFAFLYHHAVPLDSNSLESAICNVKVKSKTSRQFKSDAGLIPLQYYSRLLMQHIRTHKAYCTYWVRLLMLAAERLHKYYYLNFISGIV